MNFYNVELVMAPLKNGDITPFVSMKVEGVAAETSLEAKNKVLNLLNPYTQKAVVHFTNVVDMS